MNFWKSSAFKILTAVLSIAIGAQITINIGPIPITGQTLIILIWAMYLTAKESFIALSVYLLLGFIGFPIFADGSMGIEKLFGGSGGFLVGFLIAATLISYLKDKYDTFGFTRILWLTSLGTMMIMFCGVVRLAIIYDIEKGIAYGFSPFWKGALIKIMLGSFIVWMINTYILKKPSS